MGMLLKTIEERGSSMKALKDGCPDYKKSAGNPLTTTRRYFLGKAAKGLGAMALNPLNERFSLRQAGEWLPDFPTSPPRPSE